MTDSTENTLAAIFDGLIPNKADKPAKKEYKHKDGNLVAYGNIAVAGNKFEAILLRDGRADHNQMHESYVRAAASSDPEAAKAQLDAYWGSKFTFSYNLATAKPKKTIDTSDMPSF